ncbi:proton-coupled amino acid transporter-like protein pathetic [Zeugodacus cucurbitae]|uniref:proton-coupled amino acid transporter-like protein pathetic n=1 Tax=Zeugodacus cucurbitae TaxID=28588 RepID=UPI0023D92307|nr:proton-coupled amino acid transporter-like protein pathetic [Zeugodacus cucurbitae]XP_011184167.2 proton-coupled amino acid transporter-like protein pathetic [Zeugodacus cucurbitae]XP_054089646.1 proton-coupled amino acid transporter-like protein pathetic [Zeugodacus cucurbitae]
MTDTVISTPSPNGKTTSILTLNNCSSSTYLTSKTQLGDEYNPGDHRDQVKGQSSVGAFVHLLKGSLGFGILSMPMAFYNGGLLFSMIATLIVGFLCTHCVHILVKTSQEMCRNNRVPALSFAETTEKVFESGPKCLRSWSVFAKRFVDGGLMATYFAAACVYMVFIATSFHDVINYDTGLKWDVRIYIAFTVIPCLLIGQIRNLKWLVPFSAIANIFIAITFAIVLYYLFREPLVFSDKPLMARSEQLPLYFATAIFAMEGIGSVMPIENSMKKPQQFLGCPGVLNTAMIIVVIFYTAIGFLGYARFGSEVRGSITLNLLEGTPLADTAKLLIAVASLFAYGLVFYIPIDTLWKNISHKISEKNHNIAQILIRTGIILISGVVATVIPNLEPFISLVGAIFLSLLGFLVPSVCETVYLWPDRLGFWRWKLYKNILLSTFALCALVAGSVASINEIIKIYQ